MTKINDKHQLNSQIELNSVIYYLDLSLDNLSNITSGEFKSKLNTFNESVENFEKCDFLLGQNLSKINYQNFKMNEINLALYLLLRKLIDIPTVYSEGIHCRCLGFSKEDLSRKIYQCENYDELIRTTEIGTRCSSCVDDTLSSWAKATSINPLAKKNHNFFISKISESDLIIKISKILEEFLIYKLSFPYLILKPKFEFVGSYLEEKKSVENILQKGLIEEKLVTKEDPLEFCIQFIF